MSSAEIGDILYNEGIVGSAEEGIIAGMLMLPSIAGISATQIKRVTDANKRTANLVELTQKAEEIETSNPAVKEELIKSVTPNTDNVSEYFQDSSELGSSCNIRASAGSQRFMQVRYRQSLTRTILIQ